MIPVILFKFHKIKIYAGSGRVSPILPQGHPSHPATTLRNVRGVPDMILTRRTRKDRKKGLPHDPLNLSLAISLPNSNSYSTLRSFSSRRVELFRAVWLQLIRVSVRSVVGVYYYMVSHLD